LQKVEVELEANTRPQVSVHIRVANAGDTAAMILVVNAAFAIETFMDGTRTDRERMSESMRKGEFLLAEDESGRVVACVYTEVRGPRGYLGMLSVDPPRQRSGLGRAMVEAAESHCRRSGCLEMGLSVLSLRPELLSFYRGLGYVECGVEEFQPSRPLKAGRECHKILMSKALQ
jgi:ribosomal protein S18 acetylase RimI-like enzyme